MLGHRDLGFDDYAAIFRRRLWVLVIPTLLGPMLGYLLTLCITPKYTSQSLVLIEQPKVPENFVRSIVTSDLFERLATMQEQIESRTRLLPLIERYDLYKRERRRSIEDALEEMHKAISVTTMEFATDISAKKRPGPAGTASAPGFRISFTAETPALAQQVCSELTSMFLAENLRQREERAQGTTDFLSNQLSEAKRKLDQQDAKLAEFKKQYIGELPDDQQTNLQVLTTLNTQLAAVTDSLTRVQQDKAFGESMLAQAKAAAQPAGASQTQSLQDELNKLEDYLVVLETRYTSDHPDVIKVKKDIAKIKKTIVEQAAEEQAKAAAETKTLPPPRPEPESLLKLRAQLQQDQELIRSKTREQERIQKQIDTYQSRLQLTPVVEKQFKDLTRDYQTALAFYNKLLADKDQSQMSTDLERRQEGEQFVILDPANLPQKPSFPDALVFAGGGLAGGGALGFFLAFLIEMRDKSMRDERDIEFYLELPTLVLMPTVGNGLPKRRGASKGAPKLEGAGSRG